MRLLSWNVNGLRTFMNYDPFYSCKGAYDKAFQELGADIVCFQELKTPRASLTKAQAVPLGFDAFISLPQSGKGYSGVGTYTSHAVVVPQKAEEGLTGLLLDSPHGGSFPRPPLRADERIGAYPSHASLELMDDALAGDLAALDAEGRAVLVDVGLFVLVNVYCPNETNDERLPFKVNFLRVLSARIDGLRKEGREVVVVGDINVVHRPEDHGEGSLASKQESFWAHPARKWFDNLIAPKGPLHDVVREAHPDRQKMFTCWDVRTDARSSNYGTRLDYILVTPGLLPWIKHADILPDVRGSDHCPVYVDFHDILPSAALPSSAVDNPFASSSSADGFRLKDALNLTSDPRCAKTAAPPMPGGQRTASAPPRFCAANLDGFSEKSIRSYFLGAGAAAAGKERERFGSVVGETPQPQPPSRQASSSATTPAASVKPTTEDTPIDLTSSPPSSPRALPGPAVRNAVAGPSNPLSSAAKPRPQVAKAKSAPAPPHPPAAAKGGQTKLSSFFAPPPAPPGRDASGKGKGKAKRAASAGESPAPESVKRARSESTSASRIGRSPSKQRAAASASSAPDDEPDWDDFASSTAAVPERDVAEVKKVWGELLRPTVAPRCAVHGVECIERTVTKPGPNKGKTFFMCALPLGPGHDSGGKAKGRRRDEVDARYKCDFFAWARDVRVRAEDARWLAKAGGSPGK